MVVLVLGFAVQERQCGGLGERGASLADPTAQLDPLRQFVQQRLLTKNAGHRLRRCEQRPHMLENLRVRDQIRVGIDEPEQPAQRHRIEPGIGTGRDQTLVRWGLDGGAELHRAGSLSGSSNPCRFCRGRTASRL